MNTVIVSDQLSALSRAGMQLLVTPQAYVGDAANGQGMQVVNLCGELGYQSLGYYVSLLAQARGQMVMPSARTIDDMQSDQLVQRLLAPLDALLQEALADVAGATHELRIMFGRTESQGCARLAAEIFTRLPAPLIAVQLARGEDDRRWSVRGVRHVAPGTLSPAEHAMLIEALTGWQGPPSVAQRAPARHAAPRLAILYDPASTEPPSNAAAIAKFRAAADALGMRADIITRRDAARLGDFDALFLRETTNVGHHTYQLARQAAARGMVVLDDPDSIVQCTNKIYLAELLGRHGVPVPRTMLVHRDNIDRIAPTLGLPCILKQPDGAFSLGVFKLASEAALRETAQRLLRGSALILAQEFLPTAFDWRIGVLDRQPLFACQYFMAPGHWQIIKRRKEVKLAEGKTSALPIERVPQMVLDTALAAAGLIGDGLYGVDLKQVGRRCYVIEVNDNPNLDAGCEDSVLHDALYRRVMQVFRRRIDNPSRSLS